MTPGFSNTVVITRVHTPGTWSAIFGQIAFGNELGRGPVDILGLVISATISLDVSTLGGGLSPGESFYLGARLADVTAENLSLAPPVLSYTSVPEPVTGLGLLSGLACLAARRRGLSWRKR